MGLERRIDVRRHAWVDSSGEFQFYHIKYNDGSWGYWHPLPVGTKCKEHPDSKPFPINGDNRDWCPKQPAIADRLMHNMPDLVAALKRGRPVAWCAGEKDADKLAESDDRYGAATSVHQGESRGVTDTQLAIFKGTRSRIDLYADNDSTGHRNVLARYDALVGIGVDPKRIRIRLPEKAVNDVSDHIQAKAGRFRTIKPDAVEKWRERVAERSRSASDKPSTDTLLARFHAALLEAGSEPGHGEDWTCPHPDHDDERPSFGVSEGDKPGVLRLHCFHCVPEDTPEDQRRVWVGEVLDALGLDWPDIGVGEQRRPVQLQLWSPEQLAESPPPLPWLIKNLWSVGSAGPFAGAKKSIKTYCAMACGVAVASGEDAFGYAGWSVPEALPVLYLCAEGGLNMARRRLQRIANPGLS